MKKASLTIAVFSLFFLIGCPQPKTETLSCDLPPAAKQAATPNLLNINFYVDGTPSMQGYVVNNPETRYTKMLQLLDSVFLAPPAEGVKSEVFYGRLGTSIQKISRDQFRRAQTEEFYSGSSPEFSLLPVSQITQAITEASAGKLTVIVTDLYQKDADVNGLTKAITANYLNKDKKDFAVGIIAVRSEFNGTIYDIGIEGAKFRYNTPGKKLDELHPFYIIFLGDYRHIKHYFEKIETADKDLLKESNLVIFSPKNLVAQASFLEDRPQLPQGIDKMSAINNGEIAAEAKDQKIQMLKISRDLSQEGSKSLEISYKVPISPSKYTVPIDYTKIEGLESIKIFSKITKNFEIYNSSNWIKFIKWQMTNNNLLEFNTQINQSDVDKGVYWIVVDAVAKGLKEQEWWEKWSLPQSGTDGSKTNNLSNFLRQLKTITEDLIKSDPPVIGRFCYAIQKD